MDKIDLIRTIKAVMTEMGYHESERAKISRELDARGIRTLKGKTWGDNLAKYGNFWRDNKHLLDAEPTDTPTDEFTARMAANVENEQSTQDLAPVRQTDLGSDSGAPESEHSEHTEHTALYLSEEVRGDFMAMLAWWRENREMLTSTDTPLQRPRFKGPRDATKTCRLSVEMARAAESYAHKHRALSGGTFSGLVEMLLWKCLGEPAQFVEPEK